MSDYIVSVDIGSTKVAAIIAKISSDGRLQVLGDGITPCRAIKKFVLADEDSIVRAIKQSVGLAQKKAGLTVHSLYINIHGIFLSYIRNDASITFDEVEKEITKNDIAQLIKKVAQIEVFEDEKIVDVMPVNYIINEETSVNDPVGLHGRRLAMEADVVLGHSDVVRSVCQCVQKAGYVVDGVIPEASSVMKFLLKPSEQKENTLLIDVGGSLTEFSVYNRNSIIFNTTVPIGGEHITSDVAKVFSITVSEADGIKRDLKVAGPGFLKEDRDVTVYHLNKGDSEVLKASSIAEVMEARVYEIFEKVKEKAEENSIDISSVKNLILAGEGVRGLAGTDTIIKNVLGLQPRNPQFFVETGYSPVYTVAYCMADYVASCLETGRSSSMAVQNSTAPVVKYKKKIIFLDKIVGFLRDFFSLNKLE